MRLTVNPFFTVSRTDGWKIRSLPSFYDREVFISWLEENKERRLEGLAPHGLRRGRILTANRA